MESAQTSTSLEALLRGKPSVYPSAKGTVYVWEPAPRLVVSRVVGVLTTEGASAMELAGRRALARYTGYTGFHDWEAMTDYETAARTQLTKFGLETLKATEAFHILVRSKMVQLGVQAVALVVTRIRIHSERATFEHELSKKMSERRG